MIRGGLTRQEDRLEPEAGAPARRTGSGDPVLHGAQPVAEEPFRIVPRGWVGRSDARSRAILIGAAVAAVLVNAGAVWAYWHITGSESGRADAGSAIEFSLPGRSDLDRPLTPGGTGDLIVTVTNDNDFPIRITSVSPGTEPVVADAEHRERGCLNPRVVVARQAVKVRWPVRRNSVGVYTVPGGLRMAGDADPACAGAVITVPVRVTGTAGVR